MWPFKKKDSFWEDRFQTLAYYNGEVSRGIVHTEEWKKAMESLQQEYDKKEEEWAKTGRLFKS